jgi:predicted 2-oxoglutarate/Fe(II)-dependent dioxygenase YbiX
MTDTLIQLAQQELARIRALLAAAETVLARIRANGDPQLAEKEAKTRQQIEALSAQAEALAPQLGVDPPRVLH